MEERKRWYAIPRFYSPTHFSANFGEGIDVVNSSKATEYDLSRVAWDQMTQSFKTGDYSKTFIGGVDLVGRYGGVVSLAVTQHATSAVTRFLPESVQISIDRVFDETGRKLAEAPPLSRQVADGLTSIWNGFWN